MDISQQLLMEAIFLRLFTCVALAQHTLWLLLLLLLLLLHTRGKTMGEEKCSSEYKIGGKFQPLPPSVSLCSAMVVVLMMTGQ